MSVLKNRPFRLLFFGQAISQFGDALYGLIFLFMVGKLTGDPGLVGIVGMMQSLPFLLLSPVAGVFADRHDRKKIMLFADLASTIILAVFAVMIAVNPKPETWIMLVTACLLSCVNSFFMPAKTAAIPRLVPPEQLLAANGLSAATQHLMPLIGIGLSGAVLSAIYQASPSRFFLYAIIINLATFLASALFVIQLPALRVEKSEQHEQKHMFREIREAFSFVHRNPVMKTLFYLSMTLNLMISPFMVVYVQVNNDWFGGGYGTLAAFEFAFAFGMVVASIFAGRIKIRRVGVVNSTFLFIVGLFVAAMAFSPHFWLFLFWNLACGLALPFASLTVTMYFQLAVPDHMRGRVNSLVMMVAMAAMPLGMGLAGQILQRIGNVNMFLLMGLGLAVPSALAMLVGPYRRAKMPESPVDTPESALKVPVA